jgi:hypothetical protein
MEYFGAWGTLIHEKNLKISCQTPLKVMLILKVHYSGRGKFMLRGKFMPQHLYKLF